MSEDDEPYDDEAEELEPGHEDLAAAHTEALDEGSRLQRQISEWRPTAHERYLEKAVEPDTTGLTTKMVPQVKAKAIKAYAETGRVGLAAAAAGVSRQAILNHLRDDPDFQEAWQDAKDDYASRIQLAYYQRGVVGTPKPIVGRVAKDRDGIIGYELSRSDSVLLAMGKAFMPELYGDRLQVEANVTGGVLVVGAPMTMDVWAAKHGGQQPRNVVPLLEEIRGQLTEKGESLK